ncbi:hypothetical protein C1H46_002309 [Malus baccata]|uniref:Uncharacterized protein n=1 Tax=Malus baccata TaxID=106549 RepID=A0A540NM53_MALBA|nr:hypothetical protein C1H46_002309 [Malus baccata]
MSFLLLNKETSLIRKKEKKTIGRKRKIIEAEAQQDHNITVNEAQLQFDQLYREELMKFDAIYQKDIIGIDTILGVEGFEEFKRCVSMDQKSLKKKLLEKQPIIPDLNALTKEDQNFKDLEKEEPPKEDPAQENATENDVTMEDPEQRHATDHDPDENVEDQEHERKDIATAKGTFEVQQDVQMQTPTSKDS